MLVEKVDKQWSFEKQIATLARNQELLTRSVHELQSDVMALKETNLNLRRALDLKTRVESLARGAKTAEDWTARNRLFVTNGPSGEL